MSQQLPLQALCERAIAAAQAAGRYIRSIDRASVQRQYKDVGSTAASQVVTEVDRRSEALIRQHLRDNCQSGDIGFVAEESANHPATTAARLNKPYFWCVDPLDGTLPFVEGVPGYAVSIALVAQSGVPLIGVVFDPLTRELFHAIRGGGACRNGAPISPAEESPAGLRIYADASFQQQAADSRLLGALAGCAGGSGPGRVDLHYGFGAVKNACAVLQHPAACYLKLPKAAAGGGSIWDFAATACIAREAGAWASDIHGEPLDLNRRGSSFMNHRGVLFASGGPLAERLIAAIAACRRRGAGS